MTINQSIDSQNSIGDTSEERYKVRAPLLCPICRNREATVRYSRKDSPYITCSCGVRIFVWDQEAEELLMQRVKDYYDHKDKGTLDQYKESQKAAR